MCAVLVGLAGTVFISAPPMLAAVWFPPTERTTATGDDEMFIAFLHRKWLISDLNDQAVGNFGG